VNATIKPITLTPHEIANWLLDLAKKLDGKIVSADVMALVYLAGQVESLAEVTA
jgi:uncharacterized phage-associated protein